MNYIHDYLEEEHYEQQEPEADLVHISNNENIASWRHLIPTNQVSEGIES
jgi:hypothetical protein